MTYTHAVNRVTSKPPVPTWAFPVLQHSVSDSPLSPAPGVQLQCRWPTLMRPQLGAPVDRHRDSGEDAAPYQRRIVGRPSLRRPQQFGPSRCARYCSLRWRCAWFLPRGEAGSSGEATMVTTTAVLVRRDELFDLRDGVLSPGSWPATPATPAPATPPTCGCSPPGAPSRHPTVGGAPSPSRAVRPADGRSGRMRSTVGRRLSTLASFYRYCDHEAI